jgi:hypothetical protein
MKNRMERKRSKRSDRRSSQVRGSVAAVGRIVHRVHGIQVCVACAISGCASVRSVGAERLHVPRSSRGCSWQTVGTLGVAHGRVRVCSNRCIGLGGCGHGPELRSRRHVGGGVICLRVGLDGHTSVGVASTSVGDGLGGVGSVRLGTGIRTSAKAGMAGMAGVGGGHWCGESTGG